MPGEGRVEAGKKRRAATQGLVAIRRARACHRSGRTMTRSLMALAAALTSLPAIALAQDARSQEPSYCFDLSRVVDLAMTKERFASIAGRPRQGSFQDTCLVLKDWKDCSLYGAATYTCDSSAMDTAEEAEKARAATLQQVKACLGAGWDEAAERSSPSYVVLHNAARPPAHAGARFADPPSAVADGRAVRRPRPAANARDHEGAARHCGQWAHARSRHPPVGRCRARLRPLRAAGGRARARRGDARGTARADRE